MEKKIKKIISYIKGKKNIGIADKYVLELLNKYLKNKYFQELFRKDIKLIIKNNKFKKLVKKIRKNLYNIYGVFQTKKQNKKNILLEKLLKSKNLEQTREISKEILKLHTSTRERLNEYKKIYKEIFRITKLPSSILDLASGLNPCSIILTNFKGNYYAYEISKNDVILLNKYFKFLKKYNIQGKAHVQDITKKFNFKKADICFLFKFLDLIKENRNKLIKNLIKNLRSKYLIISFSKKTISLKNMKQLERKWFNNLLSKLNLKYKKLDFENEFFYIINLKK